MPSPISCGPGSKRRASLAKPFQTKFGDCVAARIRATGGGSRLIVLMGHRDTVFPDGAAAQRRSATTAIGGSGRTCRSRRPCGFISGPVRSILPITAAARQLVEEGLMLEEDVERAAAAASDWGRPRHEIKLK